MGVYYYAVNEESKRACELNKGHFWWELDGWTFASLDELTQTIRKLFIDGDVLPSKEISDYAHFVATELWAIGPTYKIVSDAVLMPSAYEDVMITNSRFSDPRDRECVGTKLSDHLDN